MDKKILLISSVKIDFILSEVIEDLNNEHCKIISLSDQKDNDNFLKNKIYKTEKKFIAPSSIFLRRVGYPLWLLKSLITLINLHRRENIKTIICLGELEKSIFTPLAKILKLDIVWLEGWSCNYWGKLKNNRYKKFLTRWVKIICFSPYVKNKIITLGIENEKISVIDFGIKRNNLSYQENIFFNLAEKERLQASKKYFTLGTVVDLDASNQLENFFYAIKKSLEVTANIQAVVIGDGQEKKKFIWLAKKMGIENLVWFVGQKDNINKWLKNLDIYITTNNHPKTLDLRMVLQAMDNSLPVITAEEEFFSNLVVNEKTGLINKSGQSEELAQQIINLYKNPLFRDRLGRQAKSLIQEKFTLKNTVEKIKAIL